MLALAGCAGSSRSYAERGEIAPRANPGQVAATERAFARMAREDGTWTAFRHYATEDALWPSPGWQLVQRSLAGVPDPAEPVLWGPEEVWSSCDGSFAVSTGGAVFPDGRRTRFFTVWQRQRDGDYHWVLDQGLPDDGAQMAPEVIAATSADCPPRSSDERPRPVRRGEQWGSGVADDGTLAWQTQLSADCSRLVTLQLMREGAMTEVFRREAPPPVVAPGEEPPRCG